MRERVVGRAAEIKKQYLHAWNVPGKPTDLQLISVNIYNKAYQPLKDKKDNFLITQSA